MRKVFKITPQERRMILAHRKRNRTVAGSMGVEAAKKELFRLLRNFGFNYHIDDPNNPYYFIIINESLSTEDVEDIANALLGRLRPTYYTWDAAPDPQLSVDLKNYGATIHFEVGKRQTKVFFD